MKANELRIGNWIIEYKHEIEVCYIGHNDAFSECDPIPLTEDWLVKFGFEFYDYELDDDTTITCYRKHKHGHIYYEVHLSDCGFNEFVIKTSFTEVMLNGKLHHVHQLQNLYFALTNTELKTK